MYQGRRSYYSYRSRKAPVPKYDPDEDSQEGEIVYTEDGEINRYNFDYEKRSEFIPLRLSPEERHHLSLVESALDVSEYTERIDIYHRFGGKKKMIKEQLKDICSILSGMFFVRGFYVGLNRIGIYFFRVACGC